MTSSISVNMLMLLIKAVRKHWLSMIRLQQWVTCATWTALNSYPRAACHPFNSIKFHLFWCKSGKFISHPNQHIWVAKLWPSHAQCRAAKSFAYLYWFVILIVQIQRAVFLLAALAMKQEELALGTLTPPSRSSRSIHCWLHRRHVYINIIIAFLKLSSRWNMKYWLQLFSLSGSLLLPRPCKRTSRVLGSSQHMLRSQVQETAED